MTKEREALKLALEALENWFRFDFENFGEVDYKAVAAIKEALAQPEQKSVAMADYMALTEKYVALKAAQPEQEPVGLIESLKDAKPCCGEYETCWRACTPRGKFLGQRDAQRTWVGLTPQERDEINEQVYGAVPHHVAFHAAIEARLKDLNT